VKRSHIVLIGVLTAVVTPLAAGAAQGGTPTAQVAKVAKVQLRSTSIGKLLVNGSGFTLYMFTRDGHNKDTCVKINMCTGTWPPFTTTGKPKAGPGVSASKLSTISLSGGRKQVTYAGHPLYRYSFPLGPGDTTYTNTPEFGGTWLAINAAGQAVR
jgi:predicted lipoprotein with Yx(FWY)xxD motif